MNKHKAFELVEHEEEEKGEPDIQDIEANYEQPESDEHSNPSPTKIERKPSTDSEQGHDLLEIRGDSFPPMPTKTVLLSVFLLLTGLGFIIAGLVSYLSQDDNSKTLTFLLFGVFLSIPGGYYSIYLVQAYKAETPEEREEILEQIPS